MQETLLRMKTFLLETTIAGNELWRVAALFLTVLAAFIAGKIGHAILLHAAKRREKTQAEVMAVTLRAVAASSGIIALALGVWLGVKFLHINDMIAGAVTTVNDILFIVAVAWVLYCLVDVVEYWMLNLSRRTRTKLDDMLVPLVRKSLRVTIIVLALLQIATTLSEKPLTSLIAGLGITSLAIALAAKDTLAHLFGSMVIFADKPFELGDRIVVDGHDGPVEEVGFRSTRIRTLDGHLITIPNGELANKSIQNTGKRPYITRVANITITYDTPTEKVQRAVDIIKDALKDHEGMNPEFPPRVYFSDFNDASLNILVIYWYTPPDYWKYMEFGEKFNMEIFRRFNEEGIEFAFPTQTLYLAGDPNRPLDVGIRERRAG